MPPSTPPHAVTAGPPVKITVTPLMLKTHHNDGASTHEASLKTKNDIQAAIWASRVRRTFATAEFLEPDKFLENYLPISGSWGAGSKRYNAAPRKLRAALAAVKAATLEKQMYTPLEEYLTASVQKFPPKERPSFARTDTTSFPVIDETLRLHHTSPDMTATFPGANPPQAPASWTWADPSTIVEMKLKEYQDPVDEKNGLRVGKEHGRTLAQLAVNACNMLMQSRGCFVFIVGIYGTNARLFRFDRTGVIASQSFNWATQHTILPKFFWRLCHPELPYARIAGSDPTISFPTKEEKKSMYGKFCQVTGISFEQDTFERETADSRWIQAQFDNKKLVRCFTVGEPIYRCTGLFSRATRVDKVLVEDDPKPALYALKDSWGQNCRRPESEFYEILQPAGMTAPFGVAQCRGGFNLHKDRAEDGIYTTISATARNELDAVERGRRRTLTYPVGNKLTEFSSTRQLVQGFMDAIKGHKSLHDRGILHRDISIGNVLFVDNRSKLEYTTFLTDLDYSEITAEHLEQVKKDYPHLFNDTLLDTLKNLKDRTGTFRFLAMELIKSAGNPPLHHLKHDLESFYWLLVWILLRHTEHDYPLTCRNVFDHANNGLAFIAKQGWIVGVTFVIPGNEPLTRLLEDLRDIFEAQSKRRDPVESTHEMVLDAFEKALNMEGWPEADASIPFIPPIENDEIGESITTQTGGNQSGLGTDATGSESPTKAPGKRLASAAVEDTAAGSAGSSKRSRQDIPKSLPNVNPTTRSMVKATAPKNGRKS
ncbi:hypothetical protein FB451DRAFT_1397263 [Mycena latifolia]|nr:hypothetical protein FB451DRAFT_1397263 [Mycena latifolia]